MFQPGDETGSLLHAYLYRRLGIMFVSMFLVFFLLAIIYLSLRYSTPSRIDIPFQLSVQLFATHITRYLPEITTIALFLTCLLCYTRLASDNELLAMAGLGFGPQWHAGVILRGVAPVVVIVAVITLIVSHHIEARYDGIKESARQSAPSLQWIRAGHFHSFREGTLYFKQRDGNVLRHVFLYQRDHRGKTVTLARQAHADIDKDGMISLICRDGAHYRLADDGSHVTIRFDRYSLTSAFELPASAPTRRADTDTLPLSTLIEREGPEYRSALYERLSPIITSLLLPFLAFVLSYDPGRRRAHYTVIIIGIGLLITYHSLQKLSEAWLADDIMSLAFGIAWVHGLVMLVIALGWLRLTPAGRDVICFFHRRAGRQKKHVSPV